MLNLVWIYPGYGVSTPQGDFSENRSGFLEIQILSDFFLHFLDNNMFKGQDPFF